MSRQYDEKRDFYRMTVDCPVNYRHTGAAVTGQGICRNVSAGGIQFFSPEPIAIGQSLEVTITPTVSVTPPLNAVVTVLRCDAEHDGYHIATHIDEMK